MEKPVIHSLAMYLAVKLNRKEHAVGFLTMDQEAAIICTEANGIHYINRFTSALAAIKRHNNTRGMKPVLNNLFLIQSISSSRHAS